MKVSGRLPATVDARKVVIANTSSGSPMCAPIATSTPPSIMSRLNAGCSSIDGGRVSRVIFIGGTR